MRACKLLALAASITAGCWAAEMPLPVAIRNAHVVTVSGADLPKATVLLRNGLIEAVGVGTAVPADAGVIDGTGLTVYPGFIDGLSTWGIPTPLAATATSSAQPNASTGTPAAPTPPRVIHGPEDRPQTYAAERAADQVSPSDRRLDAVRAAGYTSSVTFPNKGIFEGLGAMINLAGERGRDMVVQQPVGEEIAFRFGGGGLGRSFPASLMGNFAYVRQLYLDLGQHKQAKQLYAAHTVGVQRPEYDHDLEGLAESPRILLPAEEEQQIDRVLHFGKELKVPFILYGLHEGFKRVKELKSAGVPLLVSLKWPEKPKEADPAETPDYRELVMREQAPSLPAALVKAGVKFGFYSDGLESATDLRKSVRKAMDAGLDRAEAVRALTLNVAEIYGVADRMGSIERGKIANLVVMRGGAFEEKSTVEYLFIDGRQFRPSKDLQTAPAGSGAGTKSGGTPTGDGEAVTQ